MIEVNQVQTIKIIRILFSFFIETSNFNYYNLFLYNQSICPDLIVHDPKIYLN